MTRTKKQKEYRPGQTKALIERTVKWVHEHPKEAGLMLETEDFGLLHSTIASAVPAYGNNHECYNCGSSMDVAIYTGGILEAVLLLKMAKEVRAKLDKGIPFTEANRTHIPTLATSDSIRHCVSKASYLGLVAQPPKKRMSGYWVITAWGWAALRGDAIPRTCKYWRGQLLERSQETTTLGEMFRTHTELVEAAIARRKAVETDYRADVRTYQPNEWAEYGGTIDEHLTTTP